MPDSDSQVYVVTLAEGIEAGGAVGELESHGLQIKRVLAALGQVIGEGSEQVATQLRALNTVQSVDPQQTYRALDD